MTDIACNASRNDTDDASAVGSAIEPRGDGPAVVAHIGEPKTGTTHFQEIVWRNRAVLAGAGVQLAGHSVGDQFRATQDLRGIPSEDGDPAGSWAGEWDVLAAQARRARRLALISQESIAAAERDRVEQAVRSLGPDVHVVLTVRDLVSLLPAEWQETVKHRRVRGWDDWVRQVMRTEPAPGTRPPGGFWRVHDTPEILRIWTQFVPAERVHLVTVPRRGADPDLLWRRLGGLLGVADLAVDTAAVRSNASLGFAETEFLRRLNSELAGNVPSWYYAGEVKRVLAHEILAERPNAQRPILPPRVADWARERTQRTLAALAGLGVDIVGDLDELIPVDAARPASSKDAGVSVADELDVAVHAMTALVERSYQHCVGAGPPVPVTTPGEPRAAADVAVDLVRRSPRLKRAVRRLGGRRRWVRVAAWQLQGGRPRLPR